MQDKGSVDWKITEIERVGNIDWAKPAISDMLAEKRRKGL